MDIQTILNSLQEILCEQLGDEAQDITMDTLTEDVEGWDSLFQMEVLGKLEVMYSIKFDYRDLASLESIGDIVNCIARKKN